MVYKWGTKGQKALSIVVTSVQETEAETYMDVCNQLHHFFYNQCVVAHWCAVASPQVCCGSLGKVIY